MDLFLKAVIKGLGNNLRLGITVDELKDVIMNKMTDNRLCCKMFCMGIIDLMKD